MLRKTVSGETWCYFFITLLITLQVDEKTRPLTRAGRTQQPTSATEDQG
jgi:hypothetical protein